MDDQYRTTHLWLVLAEPVRQVAGNEEHIIDLIVTHMIADEGSTMSFQDGNQLVLRMLVPIGFEMRRFIYPAGKALVHIRLYFLYQRLHCRIERILSVFGPKCTII